ncbi:ankyrin repeat domain-containing protein, partial [archaeon]
MDPAELQSFLRPYADADKPDTHWLSELGLQSDPRSSGSNSACASGAASPRTPGTRPTSGSQQRQLNAVSIQLRGRVARSAFEDMFNRIAAAEAELRRLGENPYTPGHEGKSKLAILERRLDAVKRAHAGREVVRRRYAEAPTGKIPKYVSFQIMRCFTRLQAAHQAKDVEGMLCAVEAGAPCDAMFLNGETVLTTLVRMRSSGAVERLLAAGADPNATNTDGVTASAIALVNGDAATVRILCACQATEPSALVPLALEDGDDATPVMVSIARGQVTAITLLLRNKRLDVNRRNSKLRTALMFAARFQNADAMVELLRVGARTRRTDNLGYNAIDWLRASVEYHAARSSLEESLSTTAIPSVGSGAGKTLEAALKSQFKNVTGLDITPDVEATASRVPGVTQWLPSERHLLHMLLAVWHEEGYGSYVPLHVDALPSLDWWPAARFQTHFGVHEHKSAAAAAATAAFVAGLVATATPNTQQ